MDAEQLARIRSSLPDSLVARNHCQAPASSTSQCNGEAADDVPEAAAQAHSALSAASAEEAETGWALPSEAGERELIGRCD